MAKIKIRTKPFVRIEFGNSMLRLYGAVLSEMYPKTHLLLTEKS